MIASTRSLVTIGIPTYNRADRNLKLALKSALDQTYPNLEVIVSDNCSDDDTESVVRTFSDPRIRYFRQDHNIGANGNYNFCLKEARGEFFLLLHDDDLIDLDFLDTCMKAFNDRTQIGIIRTGTRVINETGTVLAEFPNSVEGLSIADFFLGWMESKTTFYFCSTLFNTSKLKEIGGLKSKKNLYEDVVAGVKLAAKYGRVDIYDVKASFRMHDNNMGSSATTIDWCEDGLYLLDVMCELTGNKKREQIATKGMHYFCRRNYVRASTIRPLTSRLLTYTQIAKKFNHAEPLARFIYHRHIKPKVRSIIGNSRK